MTDKEIVDLFWERNEKAISATTEKYGGYCAVIARNILHNEQDTEECVNDTCLKLWDKIPPERPDSLKAFAAKIARSTALDRYRRDHAEKRGGVAEIVCEIEETVPAAGSVEHNAENKELLGAVNKFLQKQTKRSRVIFVLRYVMCESVKSIAERLGTSENNVSASLSRTRNALRKYIRTEGYEI